MHRERGNSPITSQFTSRCLFRSPGGIPKLRSSANSVHKQGNLTDTVFSSPTLHNTQFSLYSLLLCAGCFLLYPQALPGLTNYSLASLGQEVHIRLGGGASGLQDISPLVLGTRKSPTSDFSAFKTTELRLGKLVLW